MTDWGPIGHDVYERTYARTKKDGTKEQWEETVERVVRGNTSLVPGVGEDEIEDLFNLIKDFKLMPAGRHLWVSGIPGRQFLFNCHRAGFTKHVSDHVMFTFNELMKGGGVGANYSAEYVKRQAPIKQAVDVYITCDSSHPDYDEIEVNSADGIPEGTVVVAVADSREGWTSALGMLTDRSEFGTPRMVFDMSKVRSRGSIIHGFGGTASGPGPLAKMLRAVNGVLNAATGGQLTGIDMMNLDHEIATCVIAGNVRRSARMSMMHWKDPAIWEFVRCKSHNGDHWSTNISVEVDDEFIEDLKDENSVAAALFDEVTQRMLDNGEPGFFNSSNASIDEINDVRCTNPCGEIALEEWENCNLGHINLATFNDRNKLHHAARLMTRFLIRATFSDIGDPRQRAVVDRNRRIGVGVYGYQEWVANQFGIGWSVGSTSAQVRWNLEQLYGVIREEAHRYAFELRIPAPIKCTTVAPTGTVAKLSGHSEGMQPIYSRFYRRRVRYAADDPQLNGVDDALLESDIVSAGTTIRSFFCRDVILDRVEAEHLIEQQDEISLHDLFNAQVMMQQSWSDNAISFTANVPITTNVNDLRSALRFALPHLKGTTVNPDGAWEQAPYERITQSEYLAHHGVTAQPDVECLNGCPIK